MKHLSLLLRVGALAVRADAEPPAELLDRATTGDIRAQLSLAYAYRDGKGVSRDYAAALLWARLAADRGDPAAQDFVGWMFFQGLGVRHNPEVAAGYFRAAAGKSAAAAWNLG
ncbi:SEL1-like repeat protein [Urbifossiella limnaea]|uniref:Sel1 repeat protein n=1 Tax=Urbifossiella limnaea TaxID=2528023 RepID=A0A517XTZ7_9BACT|nr:SEL1-like repeat protein [Urbifossiella limnaea]QDU20957.1 Sel1 repeat protein [Urbifossiella limnaea]